MIQLQLLILFFLVPTFLHAQKDWVTEAEDVSSTVTWKNGIADIVAPKGLTLWNRNIMQGNVRIEYDARIVVNDDNATNAPQPGTTANQSKVSRLSDLNCFWLATDPKAPNGSVFHNLKQRKGIFVNQYALQLYYLGYGGNHNTTTRFRRYDGDERGISDAKHRPSIIREYTDAAHLLKPNHWYHIVLEQTDGRIRYTIDGECLVDYVDITPLRRGYFGFRTTLAHAQLRNFRYEQLPGNTSVTMHWLGNVTNTVATPQTFGVPFAQGEIAADQRFSIKTAAGSDLAHDTWTLASWPDGSVKWMAFATTVPANTSECTITPLHNAAKGGSNSKKATQKGGTTVTTTPSQYIVGTSQQTIYIPRTNGNLIDSICINGTRVSGKAWMECNDLMQRTHDVSIERQGNVRTCVLFNGDCFRLRMYIHEGSNQIRLSHTLIVDSAMNAGGIRSLGIRMNVPMQSADHKRAVAFGKGSHNNAPQGLLTDEQHQLRYQFMPVKPLVARRPITLDPQGEAADPRSARIMNDIASWDGFRLSQLSPNGYSIRKRATSVSPWIGTMEGVRANGELALGDANSHVHFALADFWQSYPSTLQVDNARSAEATATIWLWSPEAEAMRFEHYDTIAHTLEAAYEDVQPGLSTAYGIARTSTIFITPSLSSMEQYKDAPNAGDSSADAWLNTLVATPEYYHSKRAFGFWSLPNGSELDQTLNRIAQTYTEEVERNAWYGYFNYGDFMHSYDRDRGEWRYDVGGFAWDNTELATNAMLWYSFLRTGNRQLWDMAAAMSRHTTEVDCYHIGPNAGLGSRHNVSHWGCGAKEARISQAYWNRFLYFLTADERSGDLMSEVTDADQLLYTLDPMRLAQPRSADTPCTAPARLRVGPDWLAYAGNWFTEWERTGNRKYYDKILAGMTSIAALPHGLFSGPKALGYDPATGIITWEGDPERQNTNHLLSIMGGFEMMNEMLMSIDHKAWRSAWLDHACQYKEKALRISNNKFRIPRLQIYAYWHTGNESYLRAAENDILQHSPFSSKTGFFTNDAATWSLDAILLQESRGLTP